jgi:hypothetical protein
MSDASTMFDECDASGKAHHLQGNVPIATEHDCWDIE